MEWSFTSAATLAGGACLQAANVRAAVTAEKTAKLRFMRECPLYCVGSCVPADNFARIDVPMRVGMIGTGAISHKHAQVYKNIGFELTVCTDIFEAAGRKFADQYGAEFVPTYEAVCRHPKVDFVDVCTFPDFRLQPLEICAQSGKSI